MGALKTNQVAALTTAGVAAIETADIGSLTTAGVAALTTQQIAQGLTTDQVVALTTTQVMALKTNQVAALTTDQVAAIETRDVVVLTTANVAALSTNQISMGLSTSQIAAITTAGVAAITTSGIAALTTDQVVALRTDQVVALKTNQVAALSTDGTAALETRDVAVLTTAQVQQGITTSQIVALTTNQIAALTTRQVESLTTSQKAALTTDQTPHLTLGTPLVLDLNGDGISTQSINKGVQFDIFGVDQKVNTGWVTGGDGLLVMDRNHDGSINGGTELFGEGTNLANGQKAANGYAALAEMDTNGDGVVNSSDTNFSDLMVWVDSNGDGVSQEGELHSLSSLGITQLDLKAQTSTQVDNGNLIGLTSSYTTSNGATHEMADVWFATSKDAPTGDIAAAAPSLQLPGANVVTGSSPAQPAAPAPMQSQVVSMVDAMASFGSTTVAAPGVAPSGTQLTPQAAATGVGLTGMVDAMKQFDANGQPKLATGMSAGAIATTLNTTTISKPSTDILATGK